MLGGTESALGLEERRRLEGTQRGERNAGENFDRSARSRARQLKYMGDWLYSKRPSENIETKCKSVRKAEHRGKGVERQDERYWEAEGTKAMVKHAEKSTGRDVETEKENGEPQRGSARPQQPVI